MSALNIPIGHPLAAKVFGAAVFAAVQSEPGFMNLLSGGAPDLSGAMSKVKGQTSPDYPIVKVTDLSKSAGDTVSVDLFNIFTGKPIMGDKRLAGRGMSTSSSSMDIRIDQSRGLAENGGKVTQKRTKHNLRQIVQSGLTNWASRLEDQRCLVALAGARGSQATVDWVVPLQSDPEFGDVMVNAVQAPTKNRQFYANNATRPNDIGTDDWLSLRDIERISALMKDSNVPLQAVKIKDDKYAWNQPLYVLFVTERQWAYLKRSALTNNAYKEALTYATKRFDGQKHPLFMGDSIMWAGILIKPMGRYAIRFDANDTITYATSATDATGTAEACAVPVDRAILVGAQALIKAYGNEGTSDYFYTWNEELVDHKNSVEVSLAMMDGVAKTRFTINGTLTDHGVAVIDSYAPDLALPAGQALLAQAS
jgi:N4-gp56 family major capsid protein